MSGVYLAEPIPAGTNVIGHVIVDSQAAGAASPTTGTARQFSITTAGTALNFGSASNGVGGATVPCSNIEIACDLDATGCLCVGFATGDLRTANSIKVYQGQSIKFAISDVNKVWCDASASACKGSWLAT